MERDAELGYGLDPRPPPRLPSPPLYRPMARSDILWMAPTTPLFCARWRSTGHPDLFYVLDLDKNGGRRRD